MSELPRQTVLMRLANWEYRSRSLSRRRWLKFAAIPAIANLVVFSGGVAYAAWTATASGNAAAKSGQIIFTVTAGTFGSSTTAHPGSLAGGAGDSLGGDLVVSITNTSGFPLKATAVQQTGLIPVSGSCPADTSTTSFPNNVTQGSGAYVGGAPSGTPTYANYTLPSSVTIPTGTSTITLTNVVGMLSSSPNTCQNVSLTIPVTITASS
jgi:hypothetical protein